MHDIHDTHNAHDRNARDKKKTDGGKRESPRGKEWVRVGPREEKRTKRGRER